MNFSSRLTFAALALGAVAAAPAATIADLAGDFDAANNPGLVSGWSYGYSTLANAADFSLYDSNAAVSATYGAANATGWSSTLSPNGVYPYVAKNLQDWTYAGAVNFTGGSVILHPGNAASHLFSVARYTALTSLGFVQVESMFQRLESGGSSTYGIYRNGVLLPGFGGAIAGTGAAFGPAGTTVFLGAGDRLDFVLGPGGDSFGGDVNVVSARISSVPGPAAGVTMGLGLLARGRRRRRNAR